jgi:hypothetical protein
MGLQPTGGDSSSSDNKAGSMIGAWWWYEWLEVLSGACVAYRRIKCGAGREIYSGHRESRARTKGRGVEVED